MKNKSKSKSKKKKRQHTVAWGMAGGSVVAWCFGAARGERRGGGWSRN
jgi:hypothetical protein